MEDFSRKVGTSCLLLILLLVVMGFIPAMSIGGVDLKRINILSELSLSDKSFDFNYDSNYDFGADFDPNIEIPDVVALELDEEEYQIDLHEVSASAAEARELLAMLSDETNETNDSVNSIDSTNSDNSTTQIDPQDLNTLQIDTTRLLKEAKLTPIENFDSTEFTSLDRLYTKLNTPNATIRIAVLGDSFIEGDIITCDLREIFQSRYCGCGTGFAPIDSPLTRYRKTIKTTSSGWTTYNVMQKRTTPEDLAPYYPVSGWVSKPENGATTKWEGSEARKYLNSWGETHILFRCDSRTVIETVVNDTDLQTHTFDGKNMVQQIKLTQPDIHSVSLKIVSGAEGFIGYGAIFNSPQKDGGVCVDNYSIRSNNGQAMLWTNPSVNVQIDHLVGGYDLVILQYGLNIMQKGVNNYTRYGAQVEKMIAYVKECFPQAAVLVMGVSDRSMKEDGTYRPMSEAPRLTHYQRQAAHNAGVAFWSTYDAMQAQGGMSNFVSEGWAAKDFTHINLAGGRQIAMALADALIFDHYKCCPLIVRHDHENIIQPISNEVVVGSISIE
ncbi:MAG: hypothetical protein SNG27_01260 [Rikenellaceae bacterium]